MFRVRPLHAHHDVEVGYAHPIKQHPYRINPSIGTYEIGSGVYATEWHY